MAFTFCALSSPGRLLVHEPSRWVPMKEISREPLYTNSGSEDRLVAAADNKHSNNSTFGRWSILAPPRFKIKRV
jgi:hypothetical protein